MDSLTCEACGGNGYVEQWDAAIGEPYDQPCDCCAHVLLLPAPQWEKEALSEIDAIRAGAAQ